MRSHRTLLSLAVVAALTGCRSNPGGGWALWNPFSRGADTAVASTDPKLPSQQFALADKSATPAANTSTASTANSSAPAYTPPAAVARAAAATPTTNSATTPSGAPSYTPPTGIAAKPASNSLASSGTSASTSPSGPYNPNGYSPAMSATTESSAGIDRYGAASRYDTTASTSAPTTPMAMPPLESMPTSSPASDRYATYEPAATSSAPMTTTSPMPPAPSTTPVASAPATTTPAPTADSNNVSPASATVNITAPAGQYRPGGTTSYPLNAEQVNVASLPEKPATTPAPTTSPEATSPGRYPSTGAPEPSSIYGVPAPSYR